MATWHVRPEGSPTAVAATGPVEIAQGLRDGVWLPTDEVRGPGDADWVALERHPQFEEIANDIEPVIEKHDDTNLDMNPLIDVCLVLLIFFILTITYDSLRRSIDVPPEQADQKGKAVKLSKEDRDRLFKLVAYMDGNELVILLEGKKVTPATLATDMKALIESTGRKEMYLDVSGDVEWGILTQIIDTAKGSGVREIFRRSTK